MKLDGSELDLNGCFSVHLPSFSDPRGGFQKLFHEDAFSRFLPGFLPHEAYLTNSAQGVLRGMHFQRPPHDHAKVVICLGGAALDVLVDLRAGDGYGKTASVELTPDGVNCVLIPSGIAHGFYSRSDGTQFLYLVETVHAPDSDAGVMWDSIGFDWPVANPILSDRDKAHPTLADFVPPQRWRNE
jgi:dTDP-4-dehydrorhamnose 3,5-epimerase